MLYGLLELLLSAIKEFHGLAAQSFNYWLGVAGGLSACMEVVFFMSGRLVRNDWRPGPALASFAGIAFPLCFLLILLFPASSYLKPAVATLLGVWQQSFSADGEWNQETFRKEYWAVKALKKPDGKPLEDFVGNPAPEDGGHLIPMTAPASKALVADIDSRRVAEHFKKNFSFLAELLWTQERPLPEILRGDMDQFFKANPGASYDHAKAVKLAGAEMQALLEQRIDRIVLFTRAAAALLLVLLWLPLSFFAGRDAWKKLEPITG